MATARTGAEMRHNRSPLITSFALLGSSCIVALLLGEICVRLIGLADLAITDPVFQSSVYPGVSYEFKPNALGYVWGHTRLETNSYGLRGPEVELSKPRGSYRIGIFGDSMTFGQGVTDDKTYARVLERKLREKLLPRGRTVEVLNFGVPSYNITNIVSSFTKKGVRFGLDIAVLAPILDDFGFHRDHKADQYGYPAHAGTPLNPGLLKNMLRHVHLAYLFRDAYWNLTGVATTEWRALTETDNESEMARATWERAEREITRFAAVASERGIIPIYVDIGAGARQTDQVIDLLGLEHIQMAPVRARYTAAELHVSARDAHPSPLQHNLIANELFKVTGPIIETILGRDGAGAMGGPSNGDVASGARGGD